MKSGPSAQDEHGGSSVSYTVVNSGALWFAWLYARGGGENTLVSILKFSMLILCLFICEVV